jgi:hypothetical protein
LNRKSIFALLLLAIASASTGAWADCPDDPGTPESDPMSWFGLESDPCSGGGGESPPPDPDPEGCNPSNPCREN